MIEVRTHGMSAPMHISRPAEPRQEEDPHQRRWSRTVSVRRAPGRSTPVVRVRLEGPCRRIVTPRTAGSKQRDGCGSLAGAVLPVADRRRDRFADLHRRGRATQVRGADLARPRISSTAHSTFSAAACSPTWRSSIAPDRIMAIGLATPWPAMSGALPCTAFEHRVLPADVGAGDQPEPADEPGARGRSGCRRRGWATAARRIPAGFTGEPAARGGRSGSPATRRRGTLAASCSAVFRNRPSE